LQLAHALTCALLWAWKLITLASVMSTIRAEWQGRNMELSAAVNFAKATKTDTNSANTTGKTCHFHPHLVNNHVTV
jgi:hypothetical protein